jgi:hypothetical protein
MLARTALAAPAVDEAEAGCRVQAQGAYLVNHKFDDLWKIYSDCRAQNGLSDVSLTVTSVDCENPEAKPFCKQSSPFDFSKGAIPGPRQPSDKLDIGDLMKILKEEGVFLQIKPTDVQQFSIPTDTILPVDRLQIQEFEQDRIRTNPNGGVLNPAINDVIRNQIIVPDLDGGVMRQE